MVLTEKNKLQGVGDLKAAVYSGTRNVYQDMARSCKSLLANSDVDTVFFLIEDDEFPEALPSCVKVMNVSSQRIFKKTGPNYACPWTYMVLMRAAYPKIFEHQDTILSLDIDTTVVGDISDLFKIKFEDEYIAGVAEPSKAEAGEPYINCGVMLLNLAKMREDGLDKLAVQKLNKTKYHFAEQDVFNELFAGKKLVLPPEYNISLWTQNSGKTKIRHFAAERGWRDKELVKKWDRVPWSNFEKRGKRG